MKQKVFEQAHNLSNYKDYHKCYDRLFHIMFLKHLSRNLRIYITYCFIYQLNQIKRYKSYDSFVLIITPIIFFHIITINFIIALFSIKIKNNYLFIIICKFNKRNLFIIDKEI